MAKYDRNPAPHRRLKKGARGGDVKRLQVAINLRLKRKRARTRVATDGVLGPKTVIGYRRAANLIGLPHYKITVRCQAAMRWPWTRTPAMVRRGVRNAKASKARNAGTPGVKALRAANGMVGKTETGQNDAPWLRAMEKRIVKAGIRLGWMIPGNPYCGFGCVWAWLFGGVKLPAGTVYTPNICPGGRGYGKKVAASQAKPGDLVVMNFGSGKAKHVGLARGPARNGSIPTVEFNTSPTNANSQANGGGVWRRVRPLGFVLCVVRPPIDRRTP